MKILPRLRNDTVLISSHATFMAASFGFRNMGRSGAILERNVKDAW
jgi:hypothetical protein